MQEIRKTDHRARLRHDLGQGRPRLAATGTRREPRSLGGRKPSPHPRRHLPRRRLQAPGPQRARKPRDPQHPRPCGHRPQPAEAAPTLPQLRRCPPPLCRPAQAGPARRHKTRRTAPTLRPKPQASEPDPQPGRPLARPGFAEADPSRPDPRRHRVADVRTSQIADSNASTRAAIKTPIASQQQAWDLLESPYRPLPLDPPQSAVIRRARATIPAPCDTATGNGCLPRRTPPISNGCRHALIRGYGPHRTPRTGQPCSIPCPGSVLDPNLVELSLWAPGATAVPEVSHPLLLSFSCRRRSPAARRRGSRARRRTRRKRRPIAVHSVEVVACPRRLVQCECQCMGGFSAKLAGQLGIPPLRVDKMGCSCSPKQPRLQSARPPAVGHGGCSCSPKQPRLQFMPLPARRPVRCSCSPKQPRLQCRSRAT